MPEIQLSEETYSRLKRLARPFIDPTPESVIVRLLDTCELQETARQHGQDDSTTVPSRRTRTEPPPNDGPPGRELAAATHSLGPDETIPLHDLVRCDLSKAKPTAIEINGERIAARSWVQASEAFVRWLIDHDMLNGEKLPILNYTGSDKYFINTERDHLSPHKGGRWLEVGGFYVDIKYSAVNHVRNFIATLDQIGGQRPRVGLSIRTGKRRQ